MPDLETSLELCTYCPRLCSHTCPVSLTSGRETVTPQAKMARYATIRLGSPGPGLEGGGRGAAEERPTLGRPLYACTGCGACTTACLHEVEPASALLRGRVEVEALEAGHPALADLPERHRHRAEAAAASLVQDQELRHRVASAGEVAYLPSCLPRGAKKDGPVRDALAALRVCDRLRQVVPSFPAVGVAAVATSGGSPGGACAGYPLFAGGFLEPFRLHAESFARAVEKYETLLVSCSACTWLLRTEYREHGVPLRPKILHPSELLAPHAAALPITRPLAAASYHDPCHLGRRLGCYEPPRQLLRRAVHKLHELAHHHKESRCCGSGGLLPTTEPQMAQAMATERLSEAIPQQGPLISACPACQHHLSRSGDGSVRDLLEILDEATTP